jgi:K+/H+ antiporter YhaU regulatory subunit KhtT
MTLMLLGNVGVISILASLVLTFVGDEGETLAIVEKIGVLAGAFLLLFLLSKSKWVDRLISRWIDHLLDKYTDIKIRDFAGILHLSGEYEITEMLVEKDHWMGSKKLGKLNLRQEGLNLIGIERSDGTYLGMPDGSTTIYEGDTLILYGRESALKRLNQRRKGRKGAMERRKAIAENQKVEQDEKMADEKAMAETDT